MSRPPYDEDCERTVVTAVAWRPGTVAELRTTLEPGDFYVPWHAAAWTAARGLHEEGHVVDPPSVGKRLAEVSGGAYGVDLVMGLATTEWYGWKSAAERVCNLARRRQVLQVSAEMDITARDDGADIDEVIGSAMVALVGIDRPTVDAVPDGLLDVDTLVDRPPTSRSAWLIPGLLRREWRVMLVGPEGSGKSVVGRQVCIMAAQGIHPFTVKRFPPVRTLIVDFENPEDVIADTSRPMRDQTRISVGEEYETGRAWVWSRPGGVDLRTRSGKHHLEAVLDWCRPDLVWLGPLYKAFRKAPRESDEDAAADIQHTIDDLRTRYGFGVMLEHHAPKSQQGFRDWVPFGSSLWLRWPEIGIGLKPDKNDRRTLTLTRWRGDRGETAWPERMNWGTVWPWEATYGDAQW